MTKKQMRKLANEIVELELIHQKSTDEEEKSRAEKRIMEISHKIGGTPEGLEIMMEIDEMVQEKLKNNLLS